MKTQLHVTLSEKPDATAQAVIDQERQDGSVQVEVVQLTTQNAPQVLDKIFAADSICLWPA